MQYRPPAEATVIIKSLILLDFYGLLTRHYTRISLILIVFNLKTTAPFPGEWQWGQADSTCPFRNLRLSKPDPVAYDPVASRALRGAKPRYCAQKKAALLPKDKRRWAA